MVITFKSKEHKKRFEKIELQLAMFIEEKDIKQNNFKDIIINISNYNIQENELKKVIDNKFVFYNRSKKTISIS